MSADPILSLKATCKHIGLSRETVRQYRRQNNFPQPYPIGIQKIGFRLSEVDAWLESLRQPKTAG
jgi:predicted DNA-binding transcriptional regulator AlpA